MRVVAEGQGKAAEAHTRIIKVSAASQFFLCLLHAAGGCQVRRMPHGRCSLFASQCMLEIFAERTKEPLH